MPEAGIGVAFASGAAMLAALRGRRALFRVPTVICLLEANTRSSCQQSVDVWLPATSEFVMYSHLYI
jgi:hypothetical protein